MNTRTKIGVALAAVVLLCAATVKTVYRGSFVGDFTGNGAGLTNVSGVSGGSGQTLIVDSGALSAVTVGTNTTLAVKTNATLPGNVTVGGSLTFGALALNTNGPPSTNTIVGFCWVTNVYGGATNAYKMVLLQ